MSANKCKFCNGSGWYEPKNMGGMMVEPCNRCDAHKANKAAQKLPQTSADVCPVCGCGEHMKSGIGFSCGGQTSYSDCGQAEDLAISRAAEIERLKAALESCPKPQFDVANKAKWTGRRAEQLRDLSGLLRDCNDLNRATHIIERLCRVSMGAEALTSADIGSLEPSFLEFLNTLCRDDRRNQRNQET